MYFSPAISNTKRKAGAVYMQGWLVPGLESIWSTSTHKAGAVPLFKEQVEYDQPSLHDVPEIPVLLIRLVHVKQVLISGKINLAGFLCIPPHALLPVSHLVLPG